MIQIARPLIAFLATVLLHSPLKAVPSRPAIADDDNNIVIKNKTEKYAFMYGAGEGSVLISEQSNTVFRCDGFRTEFSFVEFYDEQSSVTDLSVFIEGKKAKYLKPSFDYYSVDNIFYSDARVCNVRVPLEKKGAETEVQVSKTINDPRYFTTIYFPEAHKIEHKQIVIEVPAWMHLDIKEMNFEGYRIDKQVEKKENATTYTYNIQQMAARKNEPNSPGPSYIYPHLLMLCHSAETKAGRITYFNTVADQYAWYRHLVKQIGNDPVSIKQKAAEITNNLKNDTAKIKAVYKYVQDNIRYIAFEDGMAGFRPEKAQDVLSKKYGDCKGMANLTKELLQGAGFDARLCWIGTNHIAYDYSTPSLSVDNHMICAVKYKGRFYFLDATETYMGFDKYAERIQGRQVLIEDGDKFILERIPTLTPSQNISSEKRLLTIDGNDLAGPVFYRLSGESKESLLFKIHGLKKDKLSTSLQSYLSDNNSKYTITQLQTSDLNDRNNELSIDYKLNYKDAVSGFGDELYVDMDFRKEMEDAAINTDKRTQDVIFPYKQHLISETELTIPPGYKINELPAGLNIDDAGYSFSINYKASAEKLVYRKEIIIKHTLLKKTDFNKWNSNIQQLRKCYNEQVTLTKK